MPAARDCGTRLDARRGSVVLKRGLVGRARPHDRLDAAVFDTFFIDFYPSAFRVARRLLGDAYAAEDVAAEAFSRAYARWDVLGRAEYREAWVIRVTTNLALSDLRRKTPAPALPRSIEIEDGIAVRAALVAVLRSLPKRQREVIVMRYLLGYSESATCEALGISLATVRTHLARAKKALVDDLRFDDAI